MVRAAGANGPTVSAPLFTPILPPKIESISHQALVKWKKDRREYESKLQARCRVTGEDYDAVAQSIRDSFDSDLLDVFCDLQLNVASANVTEGMLTAEIEHIVASVKNDTLPDIKELFEKELRMNMSETDVNARVIDYYKSFNIIVTENGLTECFEGNNGRKEKCKRLIATLMPLSLKAMVKQCVRFTHAEAAKDPKVLFRLILEKANELERQYLRLKQEKRDAVSKDKDKSKTADQPAKGKRKWGLKDYYKPAPANAAAGGKNNNSYKQKISTSTRLPPSPCPKCKAMYWLRECSVATENEKVELLKGMRKVRDSKRAKLKRLGELLPTTDRLVTLNGILELPYCPGSGSDYTVIGRSHWEQLKAADPSVKAQGLEVPILNQAFGSMTVTANLKTKLHVRIHTAAGPVEPMGAVNVLIVDVDDGEFIVGNDLLASLGIDVDRQLEQLANPTVAMTKPVGILFSSRQMKCR